MDQSYSESDVSLSPTQILERLQILRQLQILQRGKLQKQRLDYEDPPEESTSITEIVSHFNSSTSYNTFQSLLQISRETCSEERVPGNCNFSPKLVQNDLLEGVSVLNLSQESEFIINSPISSCNRSIVSSQNDKSPKPASLSTERIKKQISLDEMPILAPKKDFEGLLLEKIQNENNKQAKSKDKAKSSKENCMPVKKKPFLRRGDGTARFGLHKNDLIIQDTKSLPWKKRNEKVKKKIDNSDVKTKKEINKAVTKSDDKAQVQFSIPEIRIESNSSRSNKNVKSKESNGIKQNESSNKENNVPSKQELRDEIKTTAQVKSTPKQSPCELHNGIETPINRHQNKAAKHPLLANKGKTWAAILTKEQDDFLQQLKQSEYYKNFTSPAKSTVSEMSCDESLHRMRQEREAAEQNMFELIENKVNQDNFNIENSFFNKFLKRGNLECSGESTPLVFQKCLSEHPELLHIYPPPRGQKPKYNETSEVDCCSEYTDCDHETCSSVSTCCSCKTVEETNDTNHTYNEEVIQSRPKQKKKVVNGPTKEVVNNKTSKENENLNDTVTEKDDLKANMTEMNAKLVATSELLKERLHELEDEIETFRKENANMTKMREEIDMERQKFYEEKSVFEQKYNEEKILSEYYLAEEKEKLTKQKQMYERYVREMRGRLNKKEKDEVLNLKREINDLKEDIRIKDAKSTATIARLRNHIKIIEKEKKDLEETCENLKKENRRIQHSNETTRRLTNLKYLEEINRKLASISARESKSEVYSDNDVKYKAYEIEKQSRVLKNQAQGNRKRAKSVPNLNVTSRYAKYFSQRDVVSQMEKNDTIHVEKFDSHSYDGDRGQVEYSNQHDNLRLNLDDSDNSIKDIDATDSEEDENNLEKIYTERFKNRSPENRDLSSPTSTYSLSNSRQESKDKTDSFFLRKSRSNNTVLAANSSNPSAGTYSHDASNNSNRSKSPVSILSNRSSSSYKSPIIVEVDVHRVSTQTNSSNSNPEIAGPSVTKTNLDPSEFKRPDGSRELRFPNGNVKYLSSDGNYSKFTYYNGDIKETFYNEGRVKYFYAETKTFHTTHPDGLEVLEFSDGQVEKRYRDGSSEVRLPNGSVRYSDPNNKEVREEWRFPDGTVVTVNAEGDRVVRFMNGQIEVHTKDHKRREYPDGTVKLVYADGTAETRYSSGRVRIKDRRGCLILDSAST